jgi:hypothetical protein
MMLISLNVIDFAWSVPVPKIEFRVSSCLFQAISSIDI